MESPAPKNAENPDLSFTGLRADLRRRASRLLDRRHQGKLDASDLVQLTMLKAHEHLSQCRGHGSRELLAWLHKILTSTWIDQVRQYNGPTRKIGLEHSLDRVRQDGDDGRRLGTELPAVEPSPTRVAVRNEELAHLCQLLDQLPADQLTAITLRHLRGEPIRAIARAMNRTEAAVGGLLRRGMKRLRDLHDAPEQD